MNLSRILNLIFITCFVSGCNKIYYNEFNKNISQVVNNKSYILNQVNDLSDYTRIDDVNNCKIYASNGLDQVFWTLNNNLLMIQIMNEDNYTKTSEGLKNGLSVKVINDLYSKFSIIKVKSEGAGDSQNNFVYNIKLRSHELSINVADDIVSSYDFSINGFTTNLCN
ncbi:hypothetical protein BEN71_09585 [Acinetobacter wuhouensis]|uniref:hypothetical protein n=1 Tax=Acinetobacter wuhouensis TaxID=1879050 RepID=UPI00083B6503|nr:hypothetical protein [Acinetobacter wuhouensis]AXQ22310.1 hypothetical protein BEN71_09585 [Acinetobacter wuhouensis]